MARKFEYKTLSLKYGFGIFNREDPDLERILNEEAQHGWRLRDILLPAKVFGQTEKLLVVLERECSD